MRPQPSDGSFVNKNLGRDYPRCHALLEGLNAPSMDNSYLFSSLVAVVL